MSEDDERSYDNSHRAFLQAFLGLATFTYEEAKPVLAAILTARDGRTTLAQDVTEPDFHSYISVLNNAISPFDLEIRSTFTQTVPPEPRTRVYALVNTTSDPVTQIATTHSADEIAFVKRVLDEIFDKNNTPHSSREVLAVKGMKAVQLHKRARDSEVNGDETPATAAGGLTMKEAEKLLKTLVEEGWLEKNREYYSVSPRTLMELRGWLLDTYNDSADESGQHEVRRVKLCQACKEIVTIGQRCPESSCMCRLHDHCAPNFFRAQRSQQCPLCRGEWTGHGFVGIRAARV